MINLFAHRGFWSDNYSEQNSIASLKAAHDNKFGGIEFDVWFFEENLVLYHDQPIAGKLLPKFGEYFAFGNNFKYWIDFKNLDEANASKVLHLVKKELEHLKIDFKNIYIAPFIANYEVAQKVYDIAKEIFAEKLNFAAVVENEKEVENLLKFLRKNNIKFLSIFYKLINKNLLEKLQGVELFPWTVNDLEQFDILEKQGIKNFITDKITPQIYDERNSKSRTSRAS